MATDEEKATIRGILTGGVQELHVSAAGDTTTRYMAPGELRRIQADLLAEDLAAEQRRPTRTVVISSSKGIG